MCGCRLLIAALLSAVFAAPASAQYSKAVFLELARDPGRADVPRTAAQLALAGLTSSATTDEAIVRPANLLLGRGDEVVISYGAFLFRRSELTNTPRQLPPFDPARRVSPRSTAPVAFAAAAMRRANWAAAAYYDASPRYAHAFSTQSATLFSASLFPTFIQYDATATASLRQSTVRVGGSVAIGSANRASVGLGVSAVRFDYRAAAVDEILVTSSTIADPTRRTFCCRFDEDRVAIRGWAPALALSGAFTPVPAMTITARWRLEPAFAGSRELSIAQGSQREKYAERVEFHLPRAYGIGAIVRVGATSVAAELARARYADVFSPIEARPADPNYRCGGITVIECGAWGFPYHATRDTFTFAVAAERGIRVSTGRFVLRGGVAHEPGYSLARRSDDPSSRRSVPAPPVVTEFEPPRESATWLSGGVAYEWRRAEVAFGIARAHHQMRLLVDVRLRSR